VGSASVGDYADLFEEFGIEAFDDVAESVADPHYLMRRGVIFGHREYDAVAAEAMANDEPFAARALRVYAHRRPPSATSSCSTRSSGTNSRAATRSG